MIDIMTTLNDSSFVFAYPITVGIILIIIALAKPIFVAQIVPLSRKQSRALAAIGGFLILLGVIGIGIFQSEYPAIKEVKVHPFPTATAYVGRTPVILTVVAENNNYIFTKILGEPALLYEFSFSGPSTNYSLKNIQGPSLNNTCVWNTVPSESGKNLIRINVTNGPPGAKNVRSTYWTGFIYLPNQMPVVGKIHLYPDKDLYPINKRIKIEVDASDPDKTDLLYYAFYRISPKNESFSEMLSPWSDYRENVVFWIPQESDVGENIIKVEVRDGDENGPYKNVLRPGIRQIKKEIYDPRSFHQENIHDNNS